MLTIRQYLSIIPFLLAVGCLILAGKIATTKSWRHCAQRTTDLLRHIMQKQEKQEQKHKEKKQEKKDSLRSLTVPDGYEIELTEEEHVLGSIFVQISKQLDLSRRDTLLALANISRQLEKLLAVEEAEALLKGGR